MNPHVKFSLLLQDRDCLTFRVPDDAQVNLSCRTILMPQNPLHGSDRDVFAVHRGSPRVSDRMIPKIFNTGLTAKGHSRLRFHRHAKWLAWIMLERFWSLRKWSLPPFQRGNPFQNLLFFCLWLPGICQFPLTGMTGHVPNPECHFLGSFEYLCEMWGSDPAGGYREWRSYKSNPGFGGAVPAVMLPIFPYQGS